MYDFFMVRFTIAAALVLALLVVLQMLSQEIRKADRSARLVMLGVVSLVFSVVYYVW